MRFVGWAVFNIPESCSLPSTNIYIGVRALSCGGWILNSYNKSKYSISPRFRRFALMLSVVICCESYADVVRTKLNDSGVAVITHVDVDVEEITLSNLRSIFSVRKRNWDNNIPIKVYVLPDKNPLHLLFCKSILKVYPYVLRDQWDRLLFSGTGIPPITVKSEEDLRAIVSATPGAIGYSYASPSVSNGAYNNYPHARSPLELSASAR